MTDVERLAAIEAIRNLQSLYVRLASLRDWRALADLFVPGGVLAISDSEGHSLARMRGREEIARTFVARTRAGTISLAVISGEIEIFSAYRALATWAMEYRRDALREAGARTAVSAPGRGVCQVRYEKHDDRWLIARLAFRQEATGHRGRTPSARPTGPGNGGGRPAPRA